MSPILTAGVSIVNLALLSYTISIIILIRKKNIGKSYLSFLTIGVLFDITATICMIIASGNKGITFHGLLGYSALLGMIIDLFLSYRFSIKSVTKQTVNPAFKTATILIYTYWIVAFITGAIIVMIK